MPPQRTIPPPAKALKTERTHEENQERAYIAASRRSDRSLEARVESARRASEIHKKRTGRSLRVTEQDVINEEMYEEEDDDMPLNYRRLTAHLQTGSADFNRRLSAYLTNHVAIRSAVEQAVQNSYAQQYPNSPQFARNPSMYQSPMLPFQNQQQQMMMPQNMQQQRGTPSSFHPYAMPPQPTTHSRSASIAVSQDIKQEGHDYASPVMTADNHRRASMPPTPLKIESPQPSHTSHSGAAFSHGGNFVSTPTQQGMPNYFPSYNMSNFDKDMLPLSTALPPESQMFLGSALDPNDPLTAMLMAGSENLAMPNNYGYHQSSSSVSHVSMNKIHNDHSSSGQQQKYQQQQYFEGLNSTLADGIAPSVLDMHHSSSTTQQQTEFQFNPSAFPLQMKQQQAPTSGTGSAVGTPGLSSDRWDQWIDSDEWGDMPTASQ